MMNELFGPRSAALRSAEPGPGQLGSLRSRPNGRFAPSSLLLPLPTQTLSTHHTPLCPTPLSAQPHPLSAQPHPFLPAPGYVLVFKSLSLSLHIT